MATVELSTETAILGRVIVPERGDLSQDAAKSILKFEFDPADLDCMHQLAIKQQAGELSDEEQQQLERYRQVGHLLDLMRSKARQSLARLRPSGQENG